MLGFSHIFTNSLNRKGFRQALAFTCFLLFSFLSLTLEAEEASSDIAAYSLRQLKQTDAHVTSILGGHTLNKGEMMWGYRFSSTSMKGHLDGSSKLSDDEVLSVSYGFSNVPTRMTTNTHMLTPMYAPSEDITVIILLPFHEKTMDMKMSTGATFTTEATGIGDVVPMILYSWNKTDSEELFLNFGVSLPTGNTKQRDDSPLGVDRKLPYAMQMGSSTTDLIPGVTYNKKMGKISYGGLTSVTLRFGKNSDEYRLGDEIRGSGWVVRELTNWLALSARMDGKWWGNIKGADPDLSPSSSYVEDPTRQGGKRLDLHAGVTLFSPSGVYAGNRLKLETGVPVIQSLDGPQMKAKRFFSATWEWVF
jgi:hypothetical protein